MPSGNPGNEKSGKKREGCGGKGRRKRRVVVMVVERERGKRRGTMWRVLRVEGLLPVSPDRAKGRRNDRGYRRDWRLGE